MAKLSQTLTGEVENLLEKSRIHGEVSVQGSFARDTWVHGEADLDIFAKFSADMERKEWTDRVLPVIRRGLGRYRVRERYAEHPFLEFYADQVRVNVVPCYDVKKGEWKSATDRTPYHTEYMKKSLTSDVRLAARFLKKFVKGIGAYGAETRVGGFSGMLVDTLALYYHTFLEVLGQASRWTPVVFLDLAGATSPREEARDAFGADLVVIDPVDPNRNLAAAVRPDKLWTFVAAARQFLRQAGTWYFFPPKFKPRTRAQLARQIDGHGHEILVISFKHRLIVPDVLWGQLMRLEKNLVELMKREDFQVYRSDVWSDERLESAILLETDCLILPQVKTQKGPPVSKKEDSQSFLERHLGASDTVTGPWVDEDRWMVDKKRHLSTVQEVVKESLRDRSLGLSIPKQLEGPFRRSVRILQSKEALSLLGKNGFDKSLWELMEARPSWLKKAPS